MSGQKGETDRWQRLQCLLERTAQYETLLIPIAGCGAVLSLAAFLCHFVAKESDFFAESYGFLILWGTVYFLTILCGGFFLYRRANTLKRPVFSSNLTQALVGFLPSFVAAAVFTVLLADDPFKEVLFWMMFYGLGLLSMQNFATRKIIFLGWAFTLTGVFSIATLSLANLPDPSLLTASALMAATFGGYHLVYALTSYLLPAEPRNRR